MDWYEKFVRAAYEVYDKNPELYCAGVVCLLAVFLGISCVIAKFAPWLFVLAFIIGIIAVMVSFIRAIINNMKNDTD